MLALFGAPLFIGLGNADLENDEAIYSFAVDRILESGDWLTPKSSPSEEVPFLEKPPLKIWIVAAGIRAGLLPHNEFGLRFWDAVFGAAAFVYVFLLAARQSTTLAGGLAAVLILFVQLPLLVLHGIRSNNMEAALMLSYAGGMFHFLEWSSVAQPAVRRRHVLATALCFVLAFMTKFVAALFLPAVIAAAAIVVRPVRSAFIRDWRLWAAGGSLAAVLIVPWFVYEHFKYGEILWQTMLGLHVIQRFTTYVDPQHLKPWSYYFVDVFSWLSRTGALVWVTVGLVILSARAVRRQLDAVVTMLWFLVPTCAISFGSSKLQHYMYPFLPPLAVAGGIAVDWTMNVSQRFVAAALERASNRRLQMRSLRVFGIAAAAIAFTVALLTVLYGPIAIDVGGRTLFKNGAMVRPWLVMILFALLAGWPKLIQQGAVPLLLLALVPLPMYRSVLHELRQGDHPLRSITECIADIQHTEARSAGLSVDARDDDLIHPPYYYFRRIRPWDRAPLSDADFSVSDPDVRRPIVVANKRYEHLVERGVIAADRFPSIRVNEIRLLLPGSFASCAR